MFHKNKEKLESFIGTGSIFKGDIETTGTLRIDGQMEGHVQADWLILGEKASVKGDLSARGIIIGGRIEGNLHAKEIVEIKAKGQVVGDIRAPKMTISEGAIFDGKSSMAKHEDNILEFQSQTGEA
ncbi:MAG: polymer-forming cytoskeletal protein [Syntrophaceae bacterium]|nr:polymer-forming cytoskeletal protein [Syntrophaceae bacterium]